jgi:hypothetical protein
MTHCKHENTMAANDKQPEFYGMDQVLGVFADAFMVAKSDGAYTLYFFQSQLPDRSGEAQATAYGTKHKCVGRIVLANQDTLAKFLGLLAKNCGATIQLPGSSKRPDKQVHPT